MLSRSRILVASIVLLLAAQSSAQPTPPNILIPGTFISQYEVQAWINETDSTNIVVVFRDRSPSLTAANGVSTSTDRGATWTSQTFSLASGGFDPCVVGDLSGRFYTTIIENTESSAQVFVYRATDGGSNWGIPQSAHPVTESSFPDKEFTTTDRTASAYAGRFYVTWTQYNYPIGDSGRVLLSWSDNGGATFSDSMTVVPTVYKASCDTGLTNPWWSIPIVNSDGSLHVFTMSVHVDSGTCTMTPAIRHSVSTNGGVTLERPCPTSC